jgi:hypothetical protein
MNSEGEDHAYEIETKKSRECEVGEATPREREEEAARCGRSTDQPASRWTPIVDGNCVPQREPQDH